MSNKDIRWHQRFENYKSALKKLAEVAEDKDDLSNLSELETEGLIQRFEYTYELAWKTLQDLLRYNGYLDISGPNPVLEQALQDGFIQDERGWRQMKKSRELTSHTYDSHTAEEIAEDVVSTYYPLLEKLKVKLEQLYNDNQQNLFSK